MNRQPIIAIDGPVGVGKSSVAQTTAERLGFLYIDSGAMYRAITLKALRERIEPSDESKIANLARNTDLRFERIAGELRILCDGEDVSEEIRLPEVSRAIAPVADNVEVRKRLVAMQQSMGEQGGVVMEGRDIGTVVFPNAEIKIYLDAEPEARARRRYDQLIEQGKSVTFEETYRDLLERDRRDRERPVGALRVADGAITVDSTDLTFDEVVQTIVDIAQRKDKPDT